MSAVMLLVAYSFSFSLHSFSVIAAPGVNAPFEYGASVPVHNAVDPRSSPSREGRQRLLRSSPLFSSGNCMHDGAARADRGPDVGIHEGDSAQRNRYVLAAPCCPAIRRAQSPISHHGPVVGVGEGDAP